MTAWDLSTASYTSIKDVSGSDTNVQDVSMSDDGYTMFILGYTGKDITEFNLTTAFDITTATAGNIMSVNVKDSAPLGMFTKGDGTEVYMCGANSDKVHQYTLSTGWDISSASYTGYFSVATQEGYPTGVFIDATGIYMFVSGGAGNGIDSYILDTAWDVTSATAEGFAEVTDSNPTGVFCNDDGTKIYFVGEAGKDVTECGLSPAYDITSLSEDYIFDVSGKFNDPDGCCFKADGTMMFVCGGGVDDVVRYDMEGAVATNIQFNLSDTFKEVPAIKANIGDTFKEVAGIQRNLGDSWKEVMG